MCVWMWMCACHSTPREFRGQSPGLMSLFSLWDPGIEFSLSGLPNKCLYPLSHFASPQLFTFLVVFFEALKKWYIFCPTSLIYKNVFVQESSNFLSLPSVLWEGRYSFLVQYWASSLLFYYLFHMWFLNFPSSSCFFSFLDLSLPLSLPFLVSSVCLKRIAFLSVCMYMDVLAVRVHTCVRPACVCVNAHDSHRSALGVVPQVLS